MNAIPFSATPLNAILLKHQIWLTKSLDLKKSMKLKTIFLVRLKRENRELMSKELSKYIASFDYFDKSLVVLSATSASIFITSFATLIGTPVGIASESLSLTFSLPTGFVRNY